MTKERYHFIGIGGVGMSALAHIMRDQGIEVTGSDLKMTEELVALGQKGAKIHYPQERGRVESGQIVVYSTMVRKTNPEMLDAKEKGCTIMHRSELLERALKGKKGLIVAGAHGKTTTSAILSYILESAGRDPLYAVGGYSRSLTANGRFGKGEYAVAEGDESDGSFLRTTPYGAIVTNIDFDHLDFWKTKEALLEGFRTFCQSVIRKDLLFYPLDDPHFTKMEIEGTTFGLSSEADLYASNIRYTRAGSVFDIHFRGVRYLDIESQLFGAHNVLNMLAASGLALSIGVKESLLREALKSFKGVKRRFEYKGGAHGIEVFDDYAHHPREIEATLATLAHIAKEKRLVVVFQPHRYTRSKDFLAEFVGVLKTIKHLVLLDIYPAGEDESQGIPTEVFRQALEKEAPFTYIKKEELIPFLGTFLKAGDVVATIGAGDVSSFGEPLLAHLTAIRDR